MEQKFINGTKTEEKLLNLFSYKLLKTCYVRKHSDYVGHNFVR